MRYNSGRALSVINRATMLRWLTTLLPTRRATCVVESYWCSNSIKLPKKAKTPLGSSVTLITVCLDIEYSIKAGQITVCRARLAKNAPGLIPNQPANMSATRTGEQFYATDFTPESALIEVAEKELAEPHDSLRKIMFGKWRDTYGREELPPLRYPTKNR
jgi:hypothetical protein